MRQTFLLLCLVPLLLVAQQTATIMTYNVLNYPGSTGDVRDPYFLTLLDSLQPDVLVVQEVIHTNGAERFRDSVVVKSNPIYAMGTFVDGPDSDNAVYYRSDKFSFQGNNVIETALRDINEFELTHTATGVSFSIYSVHLKASTGGLNETKRLHEVDSLRQVTNQLPANSNFLVVGDYNFYKSSEPGYQALLLDDGTNDGYFIDVFEMDLSGTWNNVAYAPYHTQSPRTRQFGGGASGGMDDRFDMILFSEAINTSGTNMDYVLGSMEVIGNDGNHYNDSVNAGVNTSVSALVADALHYAADHLPVVASFEFASSTALPVELAYWDAYAVNNAEIAVKWQTLTEINNEFFEVEMSRDGLTWSRTATVAGRLNSSVAAFYETTIFPEIAGVIYLRLVAVDTDGVREYSDTKVVQLGDMQVLRLYPNPTRDQLTIEGLRNFTQLIVYNYRGEVVLQESNLDESTVKLNVEELPAGLYALHVSNLTQKRVVVFVVQ